MSNNPKYYNKDLGKKKSLRSKSLLEKQSHRENDRKAYAY